MKKFIIGTVAVVLLAGATIFVSSCNCCSKEDCSTSCENCCAESTCEAGK